MAFLKKLAKNMGREIASATNKKNGIELGLEDIEKVECIRPRMQRSYLS